MNGAKKDRPKNSTISPDILLTERMGPSLGKKPIRIPKMRCAGLDIKMALYVCVDKNLEGNSAYDFPISKTIRSAIISREWPQYDASIVNYIFRVDNVPFIFA